MADFSVDFSPLGNLYNDFRQSRRRSAEEEKFGPLGMQGALSLARLSEIARAGKRDERDYAFRQQEAQRSQGNVDRSFALQKQTATEKPQVVWQEGPDGTKVPYLVGPMGSGVKQIPVEGATSQPNNPFMTGGKLNDTQSNAATYASRMLEAEQELRKIDAAVATNPLEKMRGAASNWTGYNLRSPEYQKFDQARRNFVNATLRKESGAVISKEEFDNADKQYFPQPGDSADVLAQKRQNRANAIRGIAGAAGPGYRPDFKFDEQGEIIPNARPQAAQPAQGGQPPIPGAKQGRKPDGSPGWFIQSNGKTYLVE